MPELSFDEMTIVRAVQNVVGYGAAHHLGEVIAQGIGEHLEQYLRTLAREAAQAAPTVEQLAAQAWAALLSDRAFPVNDPDDRRRVASLAFDLAVAFRTERDRRLSPTPTTEASRG